MPDLVPGYDINLPIVMIEPTLCMASPSSLVPDAANLMIVCSNKASRLSLKFPIIQVYESGVLTEPNGITVNTYFLLSGVKKTSFSITHSRTLIC